MMYINNFVVNMVSKASQPSRFLEATKTIPVIGDQPSHDLFFSLSTATFKAKMTSRNAKNHSDGRSHDTGNVATGKTSS